MISAYYVVIKLLLILQWYFNDASISNGGSTISITSATSNDAGEYVCVAMNSAGYRTASAQITVNGKFYIKYIANIKQYYNNLYNLLSFILYTTHCLYSLYITTDIINFQCSIYIPIWQNFKVTTGL